MTKTIQTVGAKPYEAPHCEMCKIDQDLTILTSVTASAEEMTEDNPFGS